MGHIVLGIFVALILAAALTFGFVLLVWFVAIATIIAVCVLLREWVRRWIFLRHAEPKATDVIEADYEDISDKHKH